VEDLGNIQMAAVDPPKDGVSELKIPKNIGKISKISQKKPQNIPKSISAKILPSCLK